MAIFYLITVTVAIVVLIIILTIIGVMLSYKTAAVFPPSKNDCPDYWTEETDPNTKKMVCRVDPRNSGTLSSYTGKIPGYNHTNGTIDFNNPGWGDAGSGSPSCSWKVWANNTNIIWDGISNLNSCK